MAPRRPRSTSNVSASNNIARAPTASPQLKKQFVLALDSIYQNNLKTMKRRDPTIVSILDQFSHVCLYSFNGKTKKWEREGFEGSIFIVEHSDAPSYGFYILNRLGTGDYSRRIFPEDDIEILGNYLMYRYYSDFTQKRLAMNLPFPLPPQYRPMFDQEFARDHSLPNEPDQPSQPGQHDKGKKGTSVTLGIWQFPQDGRVESLKDVMTRLHTYVKQGLPYPEQYRYGPGRPPPPPPSNSLPEIVHRNGHSQDFGRGSSVSNGLALGSSEVDKLFAKLQPSPTTANMQTSSTPSTMSVQSLFAALQGHDGNGPSTGGSPAALPSRPAVDVPQAAPTRGLALLDSIFASVAQPTNSPPAPLSQSQAPQPRLPSQPENIQIVSPKPQSSALPQILTQNVISSLLGLGPDSAGSRASSTARSSGSSHRSVNVRYDGDNESSGHSEGDFSAPSTAVDPPQDPAILASGAAYLEIPQNGATPSSQGDVTPRAAARGIGSTSPIPTTQLSVASLLTAAAATSGPSAKPVDAPPTNPHPTAADPAQRARSLVPFSADSELWPYPRAPLNDNDASDAGVVELDFSDTRALSDPSLFQEKQKQAKNGDKKKKSRKERAAERQKEREAIENAWDDPTKGQVTVNGVTSTGGASLSVAALLQSAAIQQVPQVPHVNGNGPHVDYNGAVTNGAVEKSTADVAREAVLNTLAVHPKSPARNLSRKEFMQELMSLIYTDQTFVDKLYQEYTGSAT
ncbi:mRNA decapping enzyme 1 [Phanerochaete sordida]|uniref:mRNA decapping enzyme 1 n=1 Tax=Phanerochaete sordida TaxID=48140 RepID=A0A9P3G0H2_9APHY|nr:mRNA decapping enzyme 1 [Phanerochaete sordida]